LAWLDVIAQDAVSRYPAAPSVKPLRLISGNIATISRSAHYGDDRSMIVTLAVTPTAGMGTDHNATAVSPCSP